MIRIIKANRIHAWIERICRESEWKSNALTLIRLEPIVGSPTEWLQEHLLQPFDEEDE